MNKKNVSAIILAAGKSERMGQNKLLLPWGKTSVLGHVISVFSEAKIEEIIIVSGAWKKLIKEETQRLKNTRLKLIHNEDYETGGMLSSIQAGLSALGKDLEAAFVALGDHPQIDISLIQRLINAQDGVSIIAPSHQKKRGHPVLIPRGYWSNIIEMKSPSTLKDFLNAYNNKILYVAADINSLKDLDTPEEYQNEQKN
jgi:molybdenum cofactor cytidylyltransferase